MMAANGKAERLWITVNRLDLAGGLGDGTTPEETLKELSVPHNVTSESLRNILKTAFQIDDGLVMKMRNHRKSLIPINGNLLQNGNTRKYLLEVTNPHQHVQPLPKFVKRPEHHEAISATFSSIIKRVDALENFMPELCDKQKSKMDQEMNFLGKKLKFLNQRFTDAENSHWEGMFTRNPLW